MVLSIVVPIYNVEKYLPKCLDSILGQNFSDFELILVNDGATDASKTICEMYANKDKRIIVLNKINGGLSSARNYGIEIAKGDFISFIDSDDWLVDNSLGEIMATIIETKSDILIAGHYVISENNEVLETHIKNETRILTRVEGLELILKDKELHSYAWDKIYKTSLFKTIRYPEGRNFEDTATTYKLFNISNKIIQINKAYYNYYRRVGSISLISSKDLKNGYKNKLDNFKAFIERSKFTTCYTELNHLNKITSNMAFSHGTQFIRYCIKHKIGSEGDIEMVRKEIININRIFLTDSKKFEKLVIAYYPRLHSIFFKFYYLIKS
jgi:glycosyltransferase involved in cell wall biosynthesis